jgi:hypothetical protein
VLKPMEKYSGKYVQIIFERMDQNNRNIKATSGHKSSDISGNVRYFYSILDIRYDNDSDKYTLFGRQYDDSGRHTTTFTSDIVELKQDIHTYLEFIWKTVDISDTIPEYEERKVEGYTKMQFLDRPPISDLSGGVGFFIGFRANAEKVRLRFFRLTDQMIKRLDLRTQTNLSTANEDRKLGSSNEHLISVPQSDYECGQFVRVLHLSKANPDNKYFFDDIDIPPIL